jgi:hypothetical protein
MKDNQTTTIALSQIAALGEAIDQAPARTTLQRYLREGKIAAAKRDKVDAKTRREGAARDGFPATATVDSKAATSQPRPNSATPSVQAPNAGAAAPARSAYAPGKFIPRPDTENIWDPDTASGKRPRG